MDNPKPDLAVYIHWPYCARICPYCDFNVYKNRPDAGLLGAIKKDLTYWRQWSGSREVTSIHFGGGTPSLMSPRDMGELIDHTVGLWSVADDVEIAIEANPNDCDAQKWTGIKEAGVTRLSLGVQTFHDAALNFLGRDHDADSAVLALETAQSLFSSVSLDLIFGWAGQTLPQWQADIDKALASGVPHVSAYQLTIEPGTSFARSEKRGVRRRVDETHSATFYEAAMTAFPAAGYEHYEVSNFARPGHRSRHNMAYWQGHDYVGVGPGAHGRLSVDGIRTATVATLKPTAYQDHVSQHGHGMSEQDILSPEARGEEYVLMGLRISDGLSLKHYGEISGGALDINLITGFVEDGYLYREGDRVAATSEGRKVLNYITEKLLVG